MDRSAEPPSEADASGGTAEAADAERAFERLAEDEALRRGLDDASFGPLLDLAASLAVDRADRFPATDALYGALRAFLLGAGEYVRSGQTLDLARAFGALLTDDEANIIWLSLSASGSSEQRSAELARSVGSATGLQERSA